MAFFNPWDFNKKQPGNGVFTWKSSNSPKKNTDAPKKPTYSPKPTPASNKITIGWRNKETPPITAPVSSIGSSVKPTTHTFPKGFVPGTTFTSSSLAQGFQYWLTSPNAAAIVKGLYSTTSVGITPTVNAWTNIPLISGAYTPLPNLKSQQDWAAIVAVFTKPTGNLKGASSWLISDIGLGAGIPVENPGIDTTFFQGIANGPGSATGLGTNNLFGNTATGNWVFPGTGSGTGTIPSLGTQTPQTAWPGDIVTPTSIWHYKPELDAGTVQTDFNAAIVTLQTGEEGDDPVPWNLTPKKPKLLPGEPDPDEQAGLENDINILPKGWWQEWLEQERKRQEELKRLMEETKQVDLPVQAKQMEEWQRQWEAQERERKKREREERERQEWEAEQQRKHPGVVFSTDEAEETEDNKPGREWQYPESHPTEDRLPTWFDPVKHMEKRDGEIYLTVNGQVLVNHIFKGRNRPFDDPDLTNDYPMGVDRDKYGFVILDPYMIKHPVTGEPIDAEIKMSGNESDNIKAERELYKRGLNPGFDPDNDNTWLDKILGGRWHHLQDAKTMQLIIAAIHDDDNVQHTGGQAMRKHLVRFKPDNLF